MKQACVATLLLLLVLSVLPASARVDIPELSQHDFDRRVARGRTLVKFYAPWCKHCKKLAPIYQDAADALKERMRFARVDATINADLKSRFQVTAYPKLVLFEDGKQVDVYEGARTFEGLKTYGLRRTSPPLKEFSSLEDLAQDCPTRNISLEPVSFVFAPSLASEDQASDKRFRLKVYALAKEKLSTHHFFSTDDERILEEICPKASCKRPALVRYEKGEEPEVFTDEGEGDGEGDRMESWVDWRKHALFGNVGAHNFASLQKSAQFLGVAMYNGESTTKRQLDYLEEVKRIARKSTTPLSTLAFERFVFAKIDGSVFKDYLLDYGIELESLPRMLILDSEQERFYTHHAGTSDLTEYLTNITLGVAEFQRDGMYRIPHRLLRFIGENPIKGGITLLLVSFVFLLGGWVCCCLGEEDEYDFDDDEIEEFQKVAMAALIEEKAGGALPEGLKRRPAQGAKAKDDDAEEKIGKAKTKSIDKGSKTEGENLKANAKSKSKSKTKKPKEEVDTRKSPSSKKND